MGIHKNGHWRYSISIFLVTLFLLPLSFSEIHGASNPGTRGAVQSKFRNAYVPGEIIVTFKKRTSPARMSETHRILSSHGVTPLKTPRTDLVSLREGEELEAAIRRYLEMPDVEYAQLNYLYYPSEVTPNDPFFDSLWALHNRGQRVNFVTGTPDADIDAPEAWELETGKSEVIIAVIDTGVDIGHPDLAGNIWNNEGEIPANATDDDGNGYIDDDAGWDFFDGDNETADPDGHGTHVSGIISAEGNNGAGTSGVGWNLKIMALKVGGVSGSFTTSRIVEAIDYAVNGGAMIINASWGGDFFDRLMRDAITRARDRGVLFVAAAGNERRNLDERDPEGNLKHPFYPASYDLDNIISVAATDQNDQLAQFSNYGVTSVDVGAPGVNILSCYATRVTAWGDDFDDGEISDWSTGGEGIPFGPTDELARSPQYSLTDSPFFEYENDTFSWAKKDVDLTNQSGTVLSGVIRGQSAGPGDRLLVQTSTDDRSWVPFRSFDIDGGLRPSISGTIPDWTQFSVDLGSIDNVPGYFRFLYETDGSTVGDGWYLDDLKIEVSGNITGEELTPGKGLSYLNGTSMSAPLVSGLAGLILSLNPDLTPGQVKSLILEGADGIPDLSGRIKSGGRINAYQSLTAPTPDPSAPMSSDGGGGGGCAIIETSQSPPTHGPGLLIPSLILIFCNLLRKRTKLSADDIMN